MSKSRQDDNIIFCPKCKYECEQSDSFCRNCGKKLTAQAEKGKRKRGNGEGSVFKRGNGWMSVYVYGWSVDEEGKLHSLRRTKSGFKTKKEALEYLPKLKEAPKSKNPDESILFMDVFKRFESIHEVRVGKSTMDCYRAAMRHFEPIGGMRFRDVGVDDLQDCVDNCGNGKRTKQNMKALAGLLYKYAMSRGIVSTNLAQFIYVGNDQQSTRPPFSISELGKIMKAASDGDSDAEIVAIMCYTGFRPNELLGMVKSAVHSDNGRLYFVGGFKTDAGRDRPVPISDKILPFVLKRLGGSSIYLFSRDDGKVMDDVWFREKVFYPVLDRLGIQTVPDQEHPARLVPYSCRHTFANLLKNVKGSDTDKAALMGHSDASMTKYYQSSEMDSIENIIMSI